MREGQTADRLDTVPRRGNESPGLGDDVSGIRRERVGYGVSPQSVREGQTAEESASKSEREEGRTRLCNLARAAIRGATSK